MLALSQLERHRVNCNYRLATIFAVLLLVFVTFVLLVDGRLVACPAYNCKKKISYSGVTDRHPFDTYTLCREKKLWLMKNLSNMAKSPVT